MRVDYKGGAFRPGARPEKYLRHLDFAKQYLSADDGASNQPPAAVIDADLSARCRELLDQGQSPYSDLRLRYPDFSLPEFDAEFVASFVSYLRSDGPDARDLLEFLIPQNSPRLTSSGVIPLL